MKLFEMVKIKQEEEQMKEIEQINQTKVDKSEVHRLEDELERVRKQIEWQKQVNNKILQEQAERMVGQLKEQKQMLETKRQMATNSSLQLIQFGDLTRKIQEANQICKEVGLNIVFRQIHVKMFVDDSGRSLQDSASASTQVKEEVQIQVQNFDKGGAISVWSEKQLDDKIVMMRDGLAALESQRILGSELQKQKEVDEEQIKSELQLEVNQSLDHLGDQLYNKEAFKTEIFDEDNLLDDADFDDDFMG